MNSTLNSFTYRLVVVFIVGCLTSEATFAQHDPQRNSVRHIAAGSFEKATKELKKGEADHSETHFVRMLLALKQGNVDQAVQDADSALKSGLPFGRLIAGPRDTLAPLYATEAFQRWNRENSELRLLHGPKLGSVTSDSASFWMRTASASDVEVRVKSDESNEIIASATGTTSAQSDFAAVVRVTGLSAATDYRYSVRVDGKQADIENAQFRTFPQRGAPAKFRVGFGGGAGFVPKWEYMWDTVRKSDPLAFLMLGDNVYIDDPEQSLTNLYCYYRRQSRPEWRRFVSSTAMYAIYDDHDFGMNDCVPGPEIESPPWKRKVWQTFRNNWVNPYYGGGDRQPGCWHDFYIGDVHFILIDGRYYRTRKPEPSMLGPVQKKWLKETLKNSKGRFKVLASPVPWTEGIKPGSRDPWDGFTQEREELFTFLEANRINGVFLIAADRHRTDLRINSRKNGYDLYEFESSKLTNRHTHPVVKTPGLVWGYNKMCSYALMSFDTTAADPKVRYDAITIDGEVVHSHELSLSSLQHD